jgi:Uma2 family endonuclease
MTSSVQRRKKPVTVGPTDHGKRMPLAVFDRAQPLPGYRYELCEGVIEVSEIPSRIHQLILQYVREQFTRHKLLFPDTIHYLGGGAEAKLIIEGTESQRHPDLSVYLTPMPELDQPWAIWTPEIVIEIVSDSSAKRDYDQKASEYLSIGVFQYWIIDPLKKTLTIKTNQGGVWHDKTYKPTQKVSCVRLPKLSFDLKKCFAQK